MSELPSGSRGTRRPSYASVLGGRQRQQQQYQQQEEEEEEEEEEAADLITSTADILHGIDPTSSPAAIVLMEWPAPPFHTPTYLRTSRHLSRLRAAHEKHAAELRELTQSTQSSTTSHQHPTPTGKLPGSSNPLLSDVIERLPPPTDESLHPLPARFSPTDKCPGLEILASGSEVRFNGIIKTADEAASVRTDYPIPKEIGIFYFEVNILSRSKDCPIGVGFSSKKANLNRLPGWESESWAYHGDDGNAFACTASGKPYGPKFGGQDVVGCGIHFGRGEAFFTRNGVFLGTAFANVKGEKLFPSVGMKKPGEHVRVNFGAKPFVFDIDGMVEKERDAIMEDINKADVKGLHPPDDEDTLVRGLVGQYLAHEGYVETARAFNREWSAREESTRPGARNGRRGAEEMEEEDIHAVNRQKIRKSILEGDIDRAMKLQQTYYPRLFDEERMRGVWFRLRCRKFVEMVRKVGENSEGKPNQEAKDNGVEPEGEHEEEEEEEEGDTQMDLDSQLLPSQQQHQQQSDRDDDQDMPDLSTSQYSTLSTSKLSHIRATELEADVLAYGRSLQEEFGGDDDPSTRRALNECFAVLAYGDWRESPMRGMFEKEGRVGVAEEVNGAVLRSLGKASEAAVEKVVAQTEALLDEWAGKSGGLGAIVDVAGVIF